MSHNTLDTLKEFTISGSRKGKLHSLPALQKTLGVKIDRLPVSVRIVLESVLRNCDGKKSHRGACTSVGELEAQGRSYR